MQFYDRIYDDITASITMQIILLQCKIQWDSQHATKVDQVSFNSKGAALKANQQFLQVLLFTYTYIYRQFTYTCLHLRTAS